MEAKKYWYWHIVYSYKGCEAEFFSIIGYDTKGAAENVLFDLIKAGSFVMQLEEVLDVDYNKCKITRMEAVLR